MSETGHGAFAADEAPSGLRCRRCGGAVGGLMATHCCPACGASVATSIPLSSVVAEPIVSRVDADLECLRCGAALRGQREDGACRNCGLPVAETRASVPPAALGADGAVALDLPCRRCGYNLRGLRPGGMCPECGASVGLSNRGDLLRFADPEWAARLARGGQIMLVGFALWIGTILLVLIPELARFLSGVLLAGLHTGLLIGATFLVIGLWLMTSSDPSQRGTRRSWDVRNIARGGAVAGLIALLCGVFLNLPRFSPAVEHGLMGMQVILHVFTIAGIASYYFHVAALLRRSPSEMYVGLCRGIGRSFAIFFGVLAVQEAMMFAFQLYQAVNGRASIATITTIYPINACISVVGAIGVLITAIVAVVTQVVIRPVFAEEARLAREKWNSKAPAPTSPPAVS